MREPRRALFSLEAPSILAQGDAERGLARGPLRLRHVGQAGRALPRAAEREAEEAPSSAKTARGYAKGRKGGTKGRHRRGAGVTGMSSVGTKFCEGVGVTRRRESVWCVRFERRVAMTRGDDEVQAACRAGGKSRHDWRSSPEPEDAS